MPNPITYRQIARVALPIVFANALVPLQGLIDTAIMGNLDSVAYLSALGLAVSVFSIVYASLNFLQYATSGLSAQALGKNDTAQLMLIFWRALLIATTISALLIFLQTPLANLARSYFQSNEQTEILMSQYIRIRLYGAPAELGLFCVIGWFAGQGLGRYLLIEQTILTLSNIILSLILVYGFHLHIEGVAWGTVLANYLALISALYLIARRARQLTIAFFPSTRQALLAKDALLRLLRLNSDLFIRTLMLVLCLSWFQRLASGLGENIVAANLLLLWLLTFAGYTLDGIAVAAETFTGQSIGKRSQNTLKQAIKKTTLSAIILAACFSLLYFLLIPFYINHMTSLEQVKTIALNYRWWAIGLPLSGVGGYLLDGFYFGATASKSLRNAMFLIALITLPLSTLLTHHYENLGIWISIYLFLWLRILLLAPNLTHRLQSAHP